MLKKFIWQNFVKNSFLERLSTDLILYKEFFKGQIFGSIESLPVRAGSGQFIFYDQILSDLFLTKPLIGPEGFQ